MKLDNILEVYYSEYFSFGVIVQFVFSAEKNYNKQK